MTSPTASIEQPILALPQGVYDSDVQTFLTNQLARFFNSYGPSSASFAFAGLSASTFSGISFPTWLFYSGASHHMTHDKSKLHNCVSLIQSSSIITADGNSLSLEGVGYVLQSNLIVDNVLYVPQLSASLLSIGRQLIWVIMSILPLSHVL